MILKNPIEDTRDTLITVAQALHALDDHLFVVRALIPGDFVDRCCDILRQQALRLQVAAQPENLPRERTVIQRAQRRAAQRKAKAKAKK